MTNHKFQEKIGLLLLFGTLFSSAIVLIGSIIYLYYFGFIPLSSGELSYFPHHYSISHVWAYAFSFKPAGIIQLGLLSLVATQILRVALLCWFYTNIKDYKFAGISFFILFLLIYSSFWRN